MEAKNDYKKVATVDLVRKLGAMEKELEVISNGILELQNRKMALQMNYNIVVMELWERVPGLSEEEKFKLK